MGWADFVECQRPIASLKTAGSAHAYAAYETTPVSFTSLSLPDIPYYRIARFCSCSLSSIGILSPVFHTKFPTYPSVVFTQAHVTIYDSHICTYPKGIDRHMGEDCFFFSFYPSLNSFFLFFFFYVGKSCTY